MYIKNPIAEDVTVNFKGVDYTIGANKTEDFPTDVAEHMLYIYGFMTVAEKPEVKKEEKPTKTKK